MDITEHKKQLPEGEWEQIDDEEHPISGEIRWRNKATGVIIASTGKPFLNPMYEMDEDERARLIAEWRGEAADIAAKAVRTTEMAKAGQLPTAEETALYNRLKKDQQALPNDDGLAEWVLVHDWAVKSDDPTIEVQAWRDDTTNEVVTVERPNPEYHKAAE